MQNTIFSYNIIFKLKFLFRNSRKKIGDSKFIYVVHRCILITVISFYYIENNEKLYWGVSRNDGN